MNIVLTGLIYWKQQNSRGGVRRIRSGTLDSCCPPSSLESGIGEGSGMHSSGSGARHDPPPSTLLRARLSLSPYYGYGSEIVYPIAEQSDEPGHSHGPDSTAAEGSTFSLRPAVTPYSDDDEEDEEDNAGSRSPLLVRHESFENKVIASSSGGNGSSERRGNKEPNSSRTSRKKSAVCGKSGNSFSTGSLDQAYQSVFRKHFSVVDSEERLDGVTQIDRTSASSKDGLLATDGTPDLVSNENVVAAETRCSDSEGGLSDDDADSLSDVNDLLEGHKTGRKRKHQRNSKSANFPLSLGEEGK